MNYQSIRAKIEAPLLTAYNNQTPQVPVYFDNITSVPPDAPKEYVRINVAFGLTTDTALTGTFDRARGALIVRCFVPKGAGPARCQQLIQLAKDVIDNLNSTAKITDSTYVRIGQITGPSFQSPDAIPHFVGRIDAGWQAMLVSGAVVISELLLEDGELFLLETDEVLLID